jgi:dipeptidase E
VRLFLSSENLGKYPEVFLQMVGSGKVALIENAKDDISAKERINKVKEHISQFTSQGFDVEEVDLRDYFNRPEKLLNKLSNFDGVFVFGGNTFILRRAMVLSGFDTIIKGMLAADQIAYGGSSAGSCVTAETLRGIDQGDRPHPEDVPSDYPIKETIWEGLGLVPFMVVPHYKSSWFTKQADATIKYLKEHDITYRGLKDGQVIVINGNKEEFLK